MSAAIQLPEQLLRLDFDQWRDIRFRTERAFFATHPRATGCTCFHLGFLFNRPVTINTVRDGLATPIPYAPNLFDYGKTRFDKPLRSISASRFPHPIFPQRSAHPR